MSVSAVTAIRSLSSPDSQSVGIGTPCGRVKCWARFPTVWMSNETNARGLPSRTGSSVSSIEMNGR